MLLMIAWLFWFFRHEERRNELEGAAESDQADVANDNKTEHNITNQRDTNNRKEIVEDNIEASFVQLDESENYYMFADEFPLEEDMAQENISIDEHENNASADFEVNAEYEDMFEMNSAFTTVTDDEVLKASLLKNRLNSVEAYQGKVNKVGVPVSSNEDNDTSGRIHSFVLNKNEENKDVKVSSSNTQTIHMHSERKAPYSTHKATNSHKAYEGFSDDDEDDDDEEVSLVPGVEDIIDLTSITFTNKPPKSKDIFKPQGSSKRVVVSTLDKNGNVIDHTADTSLEYSGTSPTKGMSDSTWDKGGTTKYSKSSSKSSNGSMNKSSDESSDDRGKYNSSLDKSSSGSTKVNTSLEKSPTGTTKVNPSLDKSPAGTTKVDLSLDKSSAGATKGNTSLDESSAGTTKINTSLDQSSAGATKYNTSLDKAFAGQMKSNSLDKSSIGLNTSPDKHLGSSIKNKTSDKSSDGPTKHTVFLNRSLDGPSTSTGSSDKHSNGATNKYIASLDGKLTIEKDSKVEDLSHGSKHGSEKTTVGKLKKGKGKHKNAEDLSHSPHAKLTDFEKVMKSRKLHTDTMDITANVLGNLGHRQEKIKGTTRSKPVSKHWARLQDAVSKRQFLFFKDRPLSPDSSE